MTPEEAHEFYCIEERHYYDYCGDIRQYQNRIAECRTERQRKCVEAEEKQSEINRNREILESISGTASSRDGLFSHLTDINGKVEEAASNFRTMVSSSNVAAFDLSQTFGENATSANFKLTEMFDLITAGKNTITGVIESMNGELQAVQNTIGELDAEIGRMQCMIDQCESDKQRCLANMAYYKKLMEQ